MKKVHDKFKAFSTHEISGKIVLINRIFNKSHGSTNINEIIREVLKFFIQKFHEHKQAQNTYKRTKIKSAPKKHLRGK